MKRYLEEQYGVLEDQIRIIKSLPHGDTRAFLSELALKGQESYIKAYGLLEEGKHTHADKHIEELEDGVERIRGLIKHHALKITWNDSDEILK